MTKAPLFTNLDDRLESNKELLNKHERAAQHHEQAALRHRLAIEKYSALIRQDESSEYPVS